MVYLSTVFNEKHIFSGKTSNPDIVKFKTQRGNFIEQRNRTVA